MKSFIKFNNWDLSGKGFGILFLIEFDSLKFFRLMEKDYGSNEIYVIEGSMKLKDRWKGWIKGSGEVVNRG